ncbi:MAG: DEAD/DEAH box helicase family protein, partial [Deltaproteobacteria bacterium]|nr:DEAD/DEAH box helicase family protein [Deltaproteobacteria bacterium]
MSQPENLLALDRLLADLRRNYPDERVRGTLFENLIQAFFRLEPFYQDHFSQVWAFPAWAHSRGLSGQDRGVDLVAEIAGERGLFSAIQCKFHQDDHPIQKSDINSFLAESGRPEFVERILVTTTTVASSAQATLEGQSVPCWIVDRLALANSLVDWSRYNLEVGVAVARPKKTLRPHQVEALTNIRKGFQAWERGTVLMACGSGKSYLSLKVAEAEVGAGGLVLFLVPSLALLSQILTEWTQEASLPLHSYAVCSDAYVGRLSQNQVDDYNFLLHELQFPATTKAGPLVRAVKARRSASHLTTIFSTYQSIEVLAEAQKVGLPEFDLIICDEAHRTTGSTFVEEEDSSFVLVHDNDYIRARKRLYMTATPKIFAVNDKKARNAETDTVVLFSMDDKRLFGPVFHSLSFSEAVKRGLLVDYKVLVLSMDESLINRRVKL